MKIEDIAVLIGVGIVGYGVYSSGIFGGIKKVGDAFGDAVGFVGSGFSAVGNAFAGNLSKSQQLQFNQEKKWLNSDAGFRQTQNNLKKEGRAYIGTPTGKIPTVDKSTFQYWNNMPSGEPFVLHMPSPQQSRQDIFSFFHSQTPTTKKKELREPKSYSVAITGNVVNQNNQNKYIRKNKTASPIQSKIKISHPSKQESNFFNTIGWQGTSTPSGVKFQPAPFDWNNLPTMTPAKSIRTPTTKKPWYQFW